MTIIGSRTNMLVDMEADSIEVLGFMFERPDWQADGACRGADQDFFYADQGQSTERAKQICRGCRVREACLEFALDHREHYGIWGGKSERERIQLRRARNKNVA